jgi:predicted HicB family RNase H-like nuclease
MVQLNLRFPNNNFYNQLKSRAEQEEISLNKLVIKALAQYLDQGGRNK